MIVDTMMKYPVYTKGIMKDIKVLLPVISHSRSQINAILGVLIAMSITNAMAQ